MLITTILVINWFVLWYFIFLSMGYLLLLMSSVPDVFMRFKEGEVSNIITIVKSYTLPPVTVLMAAYNEEGMILESTRSVLNSNYSNLYLMVLVDGATDRTVQVLVDEYQMFPVAPLVHEKVPTKGKIKSYYISKTHPNFTVIDTEHSDKSDSLNVGINACRTPLFMTIDADTLVDSDAISKMIFYFLSLSYPVAAGGGVYVLNGCTYKNGVITDPRISYNPICIFQTCEYLRSFLFGRSGWNALGGALCYAGAFSLINHYAAVEIGGYDVDNLAQDFEIITHLHEKKIENKFPYHIGFTPAAISWTDVPNSLRVYWHQRFNWQYYSLDSLIRHKKMLFNPKYGFVGMFTYPFYFFGEILGAIVEFLAYVSYVVCSYIGILDVYWAIMFFILCWGFSTFLTMATALMSAVTFNPYRRVSDILLMLVYSIVENFGFRQFSVLCRVTATVSYVWDKLIKRRAVSSSAEQSKG